MKKDILKLQSQIDGLRSKLKSWDRMGKRDKEWMDGCERLCQLDKLLSKQCIDQQIKQSKWGRIIK